MLQALKRPLWLLVPLGIVLTAVGVFAPFPEGEAGWWDRTGFVVNLASGFTAACIGIPVAFYGFQWLLKEREQEEELQTLRILLRNNFATLGRASHDLLSNALPGLPRDSIYLLRSVEADLQELIAFVNDHYSELDADDINRLGHHLGVKMRALEQYFLKSLRHSASGGKHLRLAHLKWETISSELLPRFDFLQVESGIEERDSYTFHEFLQTSKVLELLYSYSKLHSQARLDELCPRVTEEKGFNLDEEGLAELCEVTRDAATELERYETYLMAVDRTISALNLQIDGLREKHVYVNFLDDYPLQELRRELS